MLKFEKRGLIFDHNTLGLTWFKKNAMTPITYLVDEKTLRVFVGMCDENNIGRIGYVDVNPSNPQEILNYSRQPSLDIGDKGCFDDNGVIPSGILKEGNRLYMFYSGYQKISQLPYLIFAGLAVSDDDGKTFIRISKAPFLDRSNEELSIRAAVHCAKVDGGYKIWYLGGSEWTKKTNQQLAPKYEIKYKYLEASSITSVDTNFHDQIASMKFQSDDEYGLSMPQVFIENGIYKMIYSVRTFSKGYRMGYAESFDEGKTWVRKDSEIDLDVSKEGWDSEMVCFAHLQKIKETTYMLYCGNNYGQGGIGYAQLI